MTEQEWLEARARGLALRRNIEAGMARAIMNSGIMERCFALIETAEHSAHPTLLESAPLEALSTPENSATSQTDQTPQQRG